MSAHDRIDGSVAHLAPWESMPAGFATEAFEQLAAELVVLRAELTESKVDGPLDDRIVSRVITGIEMRARAAAAVCGAQLEGRAP